MDTTLPRSGGRAAGPMPAAARRILRLLQRIPYGSLVLQTPDGAEHVLGQSSGPGPHAHVQVHDWSVFQQLLRSGDIGLAESYLAGHWSTPQLTEVLRVGLANRRELDALIHGHWFGRLAYRLRHLLRRNTRRNSRRNIHAHYDLGNAFYELFLDPSMNYSSAWFEGQLDGDLVQAQQAKMRRALRMAGVQAGDRVLEIGCGWGAVAELAAQEMGAHLTGVTLSTEQLAFARARMKWAGLSEQSDLRLQDYRDIQDGPYDAIVSIEMVEAVGREYWPTYFGQLARLLKPGGRACVQSIVIRDDLFERYIDSTDFIQQYVFPGGCLPSPQVFCQQAEAAGLQVLDRFAFGADYAETLRRWRDGFVAQIEQVRHLGFDERFVRLWSFYLAYCEAGFDDGSIDVVQFTLTRPA